MVESEVSSLARRYGRPRVRDHKLSSFAFGPLNRGREAEVAMAIRRPSGRFLLQTKLTYPARTFRLPTGGIKRGEGIEHALLRETQEETGLAVEIGRFVAVLSYRSPAAKRGFLTYLFLLEERGGRLETSDVSEGISGWIEADHARLHTAARRLRRCPVPWQTWGEFRALAIEALLQALPPVRRARSRAS